MEVWKKGVMNVCRKLLSKLFPHDVQFKLEDGQILSLTGLPHPDDFLHPTPSLRTGTAYN